MGVSIGFGLGPIRVSKSLRGPRIPSEAELRRNAKRRAAQRARWAASNERFVAEHATMTAPDYRRARRIHIVAAVAGTITVTLFAGPAGLVLPGLLFAVVLTTLHVRIARRRALIDAVVDEKPAIDPAAEAAFARRYGLPDGVWEDDAPTVTIPVAGRHRA